MASFSTEQLVLHLVLPVVTVASLNQLDTLDQWDLRDLKTLVTAQGLQVYKLGRPLGLGV